MTLYHFLKNSGLTIEKKDASKLGEFFSDLHFKSFGVRPSKVSIQEIESPVNDYKETFLSENSDIIIQYLTEKYNSNG